MTAVSMGAPIFFALFGVVFVALGIGQAIYNFKNATSKNRYSAFDITDGNEEPDPLNEFFSGGRNAAESEQGTAAENGAAQGARSAEEAVLASPAFCPYCGASVDGDFSFCPKCGKKLPLE